VHQIGYYTQKIKVLLLYTGPKTKWYFGITEYQVCERLLTVILCVCICTRVSIFFVCSYQMYVIQNW
jgi:hypothetical protein